MNYAKLLTAAETTGHLVFDPCRLWGDKLLAHLYRVNGVIRVDHCLLLKTWIEKSSIFLCPKEPCGSIMISKGYGECPGIRVEKLAAPRVR
jgi:hypothetical protein